VTPNETVMSVKACSRCSSRGLHKLLFPADVRKARFRGAHSAENLPASLLGVNIGIQRCAICDASEREKKRRRGAVSTLQRKLLHF
jgi:hypothetical protein